MVVERETNKLLRCIRINNGREYLSKEFEEYCSKHDTKHIKIISSSPQKMEQLKEWFKQ